MFSHNFLAKVLTKLGDEMSPFGHSSNKLLAEVTHFGPVWGIGLRADDPDARDPRLGRGNNLL